MRYKIAHTTTYSYSEAVPICHNEVHLMPRDAPHQACIYNRLRVKPRPTLLEHRLDYFGNRVTSFAVEQAHQKLTVSAVSRVDLTAAPQVDAARSAPWEDVRDALASYGDLVDTYQFVFDSPMVAASTELAAYAAGSFTPRRPILSAMLDLSQRIYSEFRYDPSATTVSTALPTVLALRRGVCQDFAHLAIGCLRSIGIGAGRYVSGYLLTQPAPGQPRLVGADASHAWLAVYTGNHGWIDFDPTNDLLPTTEHITLAWGRDYGDICPIQGVFVGGGQHALSVSVDVATIG